MLLIFDCCNAGSLSQARGELRFEFLGACCEGQLTAPPGPKSFTSALIWALQQLKDVGRFSTPELQAKIKEFEHFPKHQQPHLNPRDPTASSDWIFLASNDQSKKEEPAVSQSVVVNHHHLDIRFHFSDNLDTHTFQRLAGELKRLMDNKRIHAKRISFIQKSDRVRDTALHWRKWALFQRANRERDKSHHSPERQDAVIPTLGGEAQSKPAPDLASSDNDRSKPPDH